MENEVKAKENRFSKRRNSMRTIDCTLEEARMDISASFKENNAVLHSLAATYCSTLQSQNTTRKPTSNTNWNAFNSLMVSVQDENVNRNVTGNNSMRPPVFIVDRIIARGAPKPTTLRRPSLSKRSPLRPKLGHDQVLSREGLSLRNFQRTGMTEIQQRESKRKAFRIWRDIIWQRLIKRKNQEKAELHHTLWLYNRYFLQLEVYAHQRMNVKKKYQQVRSHVGRCGLIKAWKQWRHEYRIMLASKRVKQRMMYSYLESTLSRWRFEAYARQCCSWMQEKRQVRSMRRCFRALHIHLIHKLKMEEANNHALSFFVSSLLSRWKKFTDQRILLHEFSQQVEQRHQQSIKEQVFQSFQTVVLMEQRKKAAYALQKKKTLKRFLLYLQEGVRMSRKLKYLKRVASRHWKKKCLQKYFETWTYLLHLYRLHVAKVKGLHEKHLLHQVFQGFRTHVAMKKETLQSFTLYKMRRAIESWQKNQRLITKECQIVQEIIQNRTQLLKRKSWKSWRQEYKLRCAAYEAVDHFVKKQKSKYFSMLRIYHLSSKDQYVKEKKTERRMSLIKKKFAVKYWRHFIKSSKYSKAIVKKTMEIHQKNFRMRFLEMWKARVIYKQQQYRNNEKAIQYIKKLKREWLGKYYTAWRDASEAGRLQMENRILHIQNKNQHFTMARYMSYWAYNFDLERKIHSLQLRHTERFHRSVVVEWKKAIELKKLFERYICINRNSNLLRRNWKAWKDFIVQTNANHRSMAFYHWKSRLICQKDRQKFETSRRVRVMNAVFFRWKEFTKRFKRGRKNQVILSQINDRFVGKKLFSRWRKKTSCYKKATVVLRSIKYQVYLHYYLTKWKRMYNLNRFCIRFKQIVSNAYLTEVFRCFYEKTLDKRQFRLKISKASTKKRLNLLGNSFVWLKKYQLQKCRQRQRNFRAETWRIAFLARYSFHKWHRYVVYLRAKVMAKYMNKRRYFYSWKLTFIRIRKLKNTLHTVMTRRLARSQRECIHEWFQWVEDARTQTHQLELAAKHHQKYLSLLLIQKLQQRREEFIRHTRQQVQVLANRKKYLLQAIFKVWRQFRALCVQERVKTRIAHEHYDYILISTKWKEWKHWHQYNKRLAIRSSLIQWSLHLKVFQIWRKRLRFACAYRMFTRAKRHIILSKIFQAFVIFSKRTRIIKSILFTLNEQVSLKVCMEQWKKLVQKTQIQILQANVRSHLKKREVISKFFHSWSHAVAVSSFSQVKRHRQIYQLMSNCFSDWYIMVQIRRQKQRREHRILLKAFENLMHHAIMQQAYHAVAASVTSRLQKNVIRQWKEHIELQKISRFLDMSIQDRALEQEAFIAWKKRHQKKGKKSNRTQESLPTIAFEQSVLLLQDAQRTREGIKEMFSRWKLYTISERRRRRTLLRKYGPFEDLIPPSAAQTSSKSEVALNHWANHLQTKVLRAWASTLSH